MCFRFPICLNLCGTTYSHFERLYNKLNKKLEKPGTLGNVTETMLCEKQITYQATSKARAQVVGKESALLCIIRELMKQIFALATDITT